MSVIERPPARASAPSTAPIGPAIPRRRVDIQALRALAVSGVVIEHFWPERLSGGYLGVDIFFVISGFLISSHLVRELTATGRIRLRAFWLRRVRRLLPAALSVVAVTGMVGAAVLPQTQWPQLARHMLASAGYVQNWTLAAESSDYFARSIETSPLMHLWSLSVEEQFYLLWPVLLLAATALARGRYRLHTSVLLTVALVGTASLALAIMLAPGLSSAYYSTPLRAWEFAVGALCALVPGRLRPGTLPSLMFSAAGTALVACMVVYTPGAGVPGAAAIPPVLATAVILLLGPGTGPGVSRVLDAAPIRWLGASSYSVYLWHWPLLILSAALAGGPLPLPVKLLLLAVTGVLAHLTRVHVEQRFLGTSTASGPVARSERRRALAFVVVSAAVVCLLAGAGTGYLALRATATPAADVRCVGAAILDHSPLCGGVHARPSDNAVLSAPTRLHVAGDRSGIYCIEDRDTASVRTCAFGAEEGAASARVALVGDSHAGQWVDPLAAIARARGWRVDLYLKSSCPLVDTGQPVTATEFPDAAGSCAIWRNAVASRIDRGAYDVVMTSAYASAYEGADGAPLPTAAFTSAWQRWLAQGTRVVVLADTPRFGVGFVPDCIAANAGDDPCTAATAVALRPDPLQQAAALITDPALTWVDLNGVRCDGTFCHTVLGGLVTVGDRDHMTIDFARSLTSRLSRRLAGVG